MVLEWDGSKEPVSKMGADTKTGSVLSVFRIPLVQVLLAFDW